MKLNAKCGEDVSYVQSLKATGIKVFRTPGFSAHIDRECARTQKARESAFSTRAAENYSDLKKKSMFRLDLLSRQRAAGT